MPTSEYWRRQGKTEKDKRHGRVFSRSDGRDACAECCFGDRCDDPTHFNRDSCPACLGTGINAGPCLRPLGCDCMTCFQKFGPIHPGNVGKDLRSNPTGMIANSRSGGE